MDRRHLSLARRERGPLRPADSRRGRGRAAGRVRGRRAARRSAQRLQGLVDDGAPADAAGLRHAAGLRPGGDRAVLAACPTGPSRCLYRLKGPSRPVPVVEDVAVPPEVLPEFLVAHAERAQAPPGDGLAVLPRRPRAVAHPAAPGPGRSRRRADACGCWPTTCTRRCSPSGGTIGGEHACGLSRTPFLRRQDGPLYDVFRQVKQIFDPHNIFNPGKIVGDDAELLTRHLRPPIRAPAPRRGEVGPPRRTSAAACANLVELQLNWDPARVAGVTAACNGCGECRTQAPPVRMCPIFRFAPCRRGVAAGQGQPDPRRADRQRRARAA